MDDDTTTTKIYGAKILPPSPSPTSPEELLALRKCLTLFLGRRSRAATLPEVSRALDEVKLEVEFLIRPDGTLYLAGLRGRR